MALKSISQLPAVGALTGEEIVELSQLSSIVVISAATISAMAADNSYNDSAGDFITSGFALGDRVHVEGFTGNAANNIFSGYVTALSDTKMTIGGSDGGVIVDDAEGETVTITKWETYRGTIQDVVDLVPTPPAAGDATKALPVDSVAGTTYTFVAADSWRHKRFTDGTGVAATVDHGVHAVGERIRITQAGAGQITLTPGASVTLNSRDGALKSAGQFAVLEIECVASGATDVFDVLGDVTT